MAASFVHLHVHSYYSMMRGVNSPEELCRAAVDAGFDTLALTDVNGFYGLINFLEAARRHKIRPVVGAHLEAGSESAVVLAKTVRGYELLCELITRRHMDERFSLPGAFPEAPGDLALLSADVELLKALRARADCRVEVLPGPAGRKALQAAKELNVPPVAANAVTFLRPEDYPLHRLVRAIGCNRTLSTLDAGEVAGPERWLKSGEEMARHFPHCPEALANAVKLAGECHTAWDHFRLVFPSFRGGGDPFETLVERCREGIVWRYGRSDEAVERRLAEEFELIRAKGFVDYFLVVADIVGRRPIHCGRGSGAASLVSYLLGITHVDPIRHNLLFGRFLNPQRKDPPDIDVDFPWDERDALLEELFETYGRERMAMVSNHTGFAGRAAVREVAKVYGVPAPEIGEVTRRMGWHTHPARLWERVDSHPGFRGFSLDPPWPEILNLASRLESLPRHLSLHCGGVILVPDRIARHVPMQRSAKGVQVIQWEKDQAETAGLVKIDLLGNRTLAVIRDTLAAILKNTGKRIDYALFNPLDDPAVVDLLARGETMGIFYVESPAMRQLQQKTRRGDFEHLVIHSSIIRPAANRYIREYVRRLHGAPFEPIHPRLDGLLSETYGIMVYQEDVVLVSMALAGFDWGEADGLRKVIGKKSPERISAYQRKFLDGCAGRGVSSDVASTVWAMIESFSGYSFCKPHSASYALVSFKSAWLKVYYPAEFMAAVLSNEGGYYRASAYISEARRMGLAVLGPDVNESEWGYTGKGRTIRMGFQPLRDIRRETLEAVLEERKRNGPFSSLGDFLGRAALLPADGPVFVKSGALDSLAGGLNRPRLLWFVESWLNGQPSPARRSGGSQMAFRPRGSASVPPLPDLTPRQKWRQEEESLGFLLSVHPLEAYEDAVRTLPLRTVPARELDRHVGERVWVVGWPVTRKEVLTGEGEEMEFVSFEDRTAIFETIFFPGAFQRFCRILDMNRAYLLGGTVESEFETVSLNVAQLRPLQAGPVSGQSRSLNAKRGAIAPPVLRGRLGG